MARFMWSVKNAATKGVVKVEIDETYGSGGLFVYSHSPYRQQYKVGRDIFATEEEAKVEAAKIVAKKIASLKKQIAKLEKVKF